jgi:hypothetical protein
MVVLSSEDRKNTRIGWTRPVRPRNYRLAAEVLAAILAGVFLPRVGGLAGRRLPSPVDRVPLFRERPHALHDVLARDALKQAVDLEPQAGLEVNVVDHRQVPLE